jgi:3-methyl-2-oxobutanoate hydroxymethyltransferase
VHALGGFMVQGRDEASAARVLADARALAEAGVYALVVEAVPAELGARITDSVDVPTIGIGAGPAGDGQVLVGYERLGLYSELRPKFVKRYAETGRAIVEATRAFVAEVRSGVFPTAEHSFGTPRERPFPPEPTGARAVVDAAPPTYGPAGDEK